jgi:hypothetical protein
MLHEQADHARVEARGRLLDAVSNDRDMKEQSTGGHLLLVAPSLGFAFVARTEAHGTGECDPECARESAASRPSEAPASSASCDEDADVPSAPDPLEPETRIRQVDLRIPRCGRATAAPGGDEAVPRVPARLGNEGEFFAMHCTDGRPSFKRGDAGLDFAFHFDEVRRSGAWKDLHDLDVAAARATLEDKEISEQLEGEIFGVKLHSRDAVRWAWLPVEALEIYALLGLGSPVRASDRDWWKGRGAQGAVGVIAVLGAVTSLTERLWRGGWDEFRRRLSFYHLVGAVGLVVLVVILVAFCMRSAVNGEQKADEAKEDID